MVGKAWIRGRSYKRWGRFDLYLNLKILTFFLIFCSLWVFLH